MSEFQNCSLYYECHSFNLSKFQTKHLPESVLIKFYEFIFISSIVIALHLIDFLVLNEFKLEKLRSAMCNLKLKTLLQIICSSLLILILPFITILITLALLYKIVCSVAIKRKDKRFVKFLDSFDVFCCLEDKTTTDIQGVIQSNTIELALENIKDKLHNVFTNYGSDKIFYRRSEDYGFYYWRRYSFIDLAHYVQIAEVITLDKNEQTLEGTENANQIVSYNDEGLFKLLIMKNNHGDNEGKDEYKIILKFHHSVKDEALIEFVARLVGKADDCHVTLAPILESDYESPDALIKMISKLCNILVTSFDGVKPNNPSRHDSFIRMKSIEWTKSDENLFCKVKDVRDNVRDFNFSDVLGEVLDTIFRKFER